MEIGSDMQHQAMGYDRAATMFSPDGHLLQVEYAEKTVRLGSASIGLVCKDGVVIVADRRVKDKLLVEASAVKIHEIDEHIMASIAGILSDARVLVEKAQLICQQHRVTYDSPIDVESVIKEIANMKQLYTQYGGARPFGVSVMMAGVHNKKPSLYVSDVTGNYFEYKACAIGENDEKIKEMLREEYSDNMNIDDGIKLAIKIFKKLLVKNFEIERFDIAIIKTEEKLRRLKEEELRKYK